MLRFQIVVSLLLLLFASSARAEIALAESLEWLAADSARIVAGRIATLRHSPDTALGKSRGLSLLTVEVSEQLKGSSTSRLCIGVRDLAPEQLERFRTQRTELLFFLSETEQATSFEGLVCNLWPLRGADATSFVVPLDEPGKRMLLASGFAVLKTRAAIVAACRDSVARLRGRTAKQFLLEAPFDSAVHKALYSKSAVYLYVPDVLFPQARPALGGAPPEPKK